MADRILSSLIQKPEHLQITVDVMNVQQLKGGSDCRVLAIAFATLLVFGHSEGCGRQLAFGAWLSQCRREADAIRIYYVVWCQDLQGEVKI